MIKKLFRKFSQTQVRILSEELRRAHIVIALLSLSLMFVLLFGSFQPLEFDSTLAIIASVLLGIITLISLVIVWMLTKKKS